MSKQSRKRLFPNAALCALAGLYVPACAAEIDEGSESVEAEQQTLTEIQVGDARVSFVEISPGNLITLARNPPGKSPLSDPAVRELKPVQLYEYLAKQPAPDVLRAAQDRSDALEREALAAGTAPAPAAQDTASEVADAEPDAETLVDKRLAAEFEALYCGHGVQKCLIYVTGNRSYEVWTKGIYGALNP